MFCDHCGAQLQPADSRCVRCGKTVVGAAELRRSRVREHVRLLGILWMAYASLHLLAGVFVIVVAKLLFGGLIHFPEGPPPEITIWLRPLVSFVGWLILAKAAACFIAGWGLLQREDWARTLALVIAFIALLNVPLGTVLGIYTLWVLLPSQSDDDYRALARAA